MGLVVMHVPPSPSLAPFTKSKTNTATFWSLTSLHLQQRLGQHAARHADGLADVGARVLRVHVADGQLAAHGDGVAAGLRGRLAGEQQHLKGTQRKPHRDERLSQRRDSGFGPRGRSEFRDTRETPDSSFYREF